MIGFHRRHLQLWQFPLFRQLHICAYQTLSEIENPTIPTKMRPNRLSLMTMLLLAAPLAAQQPIDSVYSARIKELTPTDPHWKFTTELVETLPASSTVPTPLKVNGYVPGTIGKLSHVAELNKYFKAVADASPRAKLYSFGMSDEGREMIGLVIADEATIQNIEQYRADLAKLADPRGVSAAEKARLIVLVLGERKAV